MVLQVTPPAIREIAPERNRDHTLVMTNDKWFNEKDGEQASAVVCQRPSPAKGLDRIGDVGITERHRSGKIRTVLLNTIVQVNDSVVA